MADDAPAGRQHLCHLAGRMPHGDLQQLLCSDSLKRPSDDAQHKIEHIAGTFGARVREFRATLPSSERKRSEAAGYDRQLLDYLENLREDSSAGNAALLQQACVGLDAELTDEERREMRGDWVGRLIRDFGAAAPPCGSASIPADVIPTATSHPLPHPETRAGFDSHVNEEVKVLLVHQRYAELRAIVDLGVDLRKVLCGGYSNAFNGGLGHVLMDNVRYYLALNQLILQGWSASQALSTVDHYYGEAALPPHERLMCSIGKALKDLLHVHDYRVNKESAVYSAFREKLKDQSASLDDVRLFCKEVLFPEIVGGAHILLYNQLRHAGDDLSALVDANAPSADGWNVELMVCECISRCFMPTDRSAQWRFMRKQAVGPSWEDYINWKWDVRAGSVVADVVEPEDER